MSFLYLLFLLVLIGVIMYLVNHLLPIDHRFKTLINTVVIVATLLWLADVFFGFSPRYEARGCNRPIRTETR